MGPYLNLLEVAMAMGLEGTAMAEFISAQLDRQRDVRASRMERLKARGF